MTIAAQNGHSEIVELFVAHGADVNGAIDNGATPLYIATQKAHSNIVRFLLSHNADVNQSKDTGATPLYIAAQNGDSEIVKLLLAHGAKVRMTTKSGVTPREVAAKHGHIEVVELLDQAAGTQPRLYPIRRRARGEHIVDRQDLEELSQKHVEPLEGDQITEPAEKHQGHQEDSHQTYRQ